MNEAGEALARDHPGVRAYARHVNPAFVKLLGMFGYGRLFTRARDVWVWDHSGKRYLDLLAGFGAVNVGHNHPRLAERIQSFLASEPLNFVHVSPNLSEAELAAALYELAGDPLEVALFSSSGAEAVEAGLKLAMAATGRSGFVYCDAGFHGTNLGTLSVMGEARMRKPFESMLASTTAVPFGDLAALEQALKAKPAAFLVEPILGEGGIVLPPAGYLRAAHERCQAKGTLLVLDEVQTGIGRTGRDFAFQHEEGFVPDVLVLAKALSGSLVALAATLTTPLIHERAYGSVDRFDLHSSTFGGNALSCAVGLETLRILKDEGLVENARVQGEALRVGLRKRLAGHPFVREVRGRGLLVGVELGPTDSGWANTLAPGLVRLVSKQVFGQWAALELLERGVICQPASHHWNVLRLEPPLTIQAEQVQEAIDAVASVLDDYRSLPKLLDAVTRRLGRQFLNGGLF
jgi:putrescine aminotransferase